MKTTKSKSGKKKILVTSALPYVNNVPHLGNLVCVVSADVYTKFLRLKKENVISVCGTDEHGTTTETKAIEEGLTPKEICDKYFKIHKQVYEWFGCDFDCFGRTSSKANHETTQDIFLKLNKNGYIKEAVLEQYYCEKCSRWLADRFVEGKCPKCGYEEARGDQCENCGALLDATELIDARCKVCGETPVIKQSSHLFIDLPKLAPKLKAWVKKAGKNWSVNALTMTESWLKEGVKLRCITRDLKWGIPVPLKGYENKVFYSWFDAPIGYISITKESRKDWQQWWKNPEETTLVQFMGKDNIPFHTILFPSFLIGTGENYTLVNCLSSNEYLNYESGQFSKSRNIGVFGDDAMSSGIPADVWRYYLMINRPEKTDTEFSWTDLQSKLNNELVAALGNLVNRTVTFLNSKYSSVVPKAKLETKDKDFLKSVAAQERKIIEEYENIHLKSALREIMNLCIMGNQYFQSSEPWKKENPACLLVLTNVINDLATLVEPFLPATAKNIRKQLNTKKGNLNDLEGLNIKGGHKIGKAELLFRKIDDKEVQALKEKYAGKKQANVFPLNLKVAEITSAESHPNADKLFVLKINLGKEERHIVTGLKGHYTKAELEGKKIVVVTNLKKATLRGVESNGMLLAAEKEGKIKLLEARKSAAGDKVGIEGMANSEKEITIQEFSNVVMTTKGKKVVYNGKTLKTSSEDVFVDAEDNAKIT